MTTITIKGMSCQHCVASTTKALESIPGISKVKVDLDTKQAFFEGEVDMKLLKQVISGIGFEAVD